MKCDCGGEYVIREDLSGYKGEIVLSCVECKELYFNAQEFFTKTKLDALKPVSADEINQDLQELKEASNPNQF